MEGVQAIVICANPARRAAMCAQLRRLGMRYTLLAAHTPANSTDWLAPRADEPLPLEHPMSAPLIACCTRSHASALALAGQADAPPFSIVMEDDVIVHERFDAIVGELVSAWPRIVEAGCAAVHLGYLPLQETTQPDDALLISLEAAPGLELRSAVARASTLSTHLWGAQAILYSRAGAAQGAAALHVSSIGRLVLAMEALPRRPRGYFSLLPDYLVPCAVPCAAVWPMVVREAVTASSVSTSGVAPMCQTRAYAARAEAWPPVHAAAFPTHGGAGYAAAHQLAVRCVDAGAEAALLGGAHSLLGGARAELLLRGLFSLTERRGLPPPIILAHAAATKERLVGSQWSADAWVRVLPPDAAPPQDDADDGRGAWIAATELSSAICAMQALGASGFRALLWLGDAAALDELAAEQAAQLPPLLLMPSPAAAPHLPAATTVRAPLGTAVRLPLECTWTPTPLGAAWRRLSFGPWSPDAEQRLCPVLSDAASVLPRGIAQHGGTRTRLVLAPETPITSPVLDLVFAGGSAERADGSPVLPLVPTPPAPPRTAAEWSALQRSVLAAAEALAAPSMAFAAWAL